MKCRTSQLLVSFPLVRVFSESCVSAWSSTTLFLSSYALHVTRMGQLLLEPILLSLIIFNIKPQSSEQCLNVLLDLSVCLPKISGRRHELGFVRSAQSRNKFFMKWMPLSAKNMFRAPQGLVDAKKTTVATLGTVVFATRIIDVCFKNQFSIIIVSLFFKYVV